MKLIDAGKLLGKEAGNYIKSQMQIYDAKTDEDIVNLLISKIVHKKIQMLVDNTPAVDIGQVRNWLYDVEKCNDCAYRERHQKCSCCRRNRSLKDCYQKEKKQNE